MRVLTTPYARVQTTCIYICADCLHTYIHMHTCAYTQVLTTPYARVQTTYETAIETIENMGKVVDSLYTRAAKLS